MFIKNKTRKEYRTNVDWIVINNLENKVDVQFDTNSHVQPNQAFQFNVHHKSSFRETILMLNVLLFDQDFKYWNIIMSNDYYFTITIFNNYSNLTMGLIISLKSVLSMIYHFVLQNPRFSHCLNPD